MTECKNCNATTSLIYSEKCEHLDFNLGVSTFDPGWICSTCKCFHSKDGTYFEYFGKNTYNGNIE